MGLLLRTGVLIFALLRPVYAEELTPKAIQQDFVFKKDSEAVVCEIETKLLSIPAPEAVNFTFAYTVSTDGKKLFANVFVDVGDLAFRNGVVSGIKKAKITDVFIANENFSTNGRFYVSELADLGMMGSTADLGIGNRLFEMMIAGSYSIYFHRKDDPELKSYKIIDFRNVDAFGKFNNCVQQEIKPLIR